VGKYAEPILATRAILIIEGFAERLQAAVGERAWSRHRERIGADTEELCWQLDNHLLEVIIDGVEARVDEYACSVGGCSFFVIHGLLLFGCA